MLHSTRSHREYARVLHINRVVKTEEEERTRTTTRSANSHSKRKAKVGFRRTELAVVLADEYTTEYAQVIKMLGNGRLEALCFDGEKRLAHSKLPHKERHSASADSLL